MLKSLTALVCPEILRGCFEAFQLRFLACDVPGAQLGLLYFRRLPTIPRSARLARRFDLSALRFVASPLSYTFYVAGKQHADLAWQVTLLCVTLASLRLPSHHGAALQWYSAGYSMLYVVYLFLSYRFSLGGRQ